MVKRICVHEISISGWSENLYIGFEENGSITVSSYRGGPGGGASLEMCLEDWYKPNENDKKDGFGKLYELIDCLVLNYDVTYKEIYEHIVNGETKEYRIYLYLAFYCGSFLDKNKIEVLNDFGIEEKNHKFYLRPRIDYEKIEKESENSKYLQKKKDDFYQVVRYKGITRIDYGSKYGLCYGFNLYGEWRDNTGEVVKLIEPGLGFRDYGKIEYVKLPIVDYDVIAKYLAEYIRVEIDKSELDYNTFNVINKKVEEIRINYVERCELFKTVLEEMGVFRDHETHKYFDSNMNELIVRLPVISDEKDLGDFEYVSDLEKEKLGQTELNDNTFEKNLSF